MVHFVYMTSFYDPLNFKSNFTFYLHFLRICHRRQILKATLHSKATFKNIKSNIQASIQATFKQTFKQILKATFKKKKSNFTFYLHQSRRYKL